MSRSPEQLQIFYELALEVGRSLNLFEMLKSSLNAYLKKLKCVTGIVYRIKPEGDTTFRSEMIFSIPYALITKRAYAKIEQLVPSSFSSGELDLYLNKLPVRGECDENHFFHVMKLDHFGLLILIRKGGFLDDEIISALEEINCKLGQACSACIKMELLEESEMRYRYQQELLPEMLCETNLKGEVTYATTYALEKMGYSPDDLKAGINIRDLFYKDDRKRLIKNFEDALKNDSSNSHEYRLVNKDGTIFPVLVYTNRIIRNNKAEGLISIIVDISVLKENERKLELYNERLVDERDKANSANKAKSEFLANMSHEIRTPMNAILGFSEALYHKLGSDQHRKMVKSVLVSGSLLMSLLNDILDLSKIESGKMEISPTAIDLNYILREIRMLFEDRANSKGIEISVEIENNFPSLILLDEIRIKQVIFNLVGNAIKFTHSGYVRVMVSFSYLKKLSGVLTIEVEDTGIGIPEAGQKVIFEAFGQESAQSGSMYGGVGLGLAISRRLVEHMNGTITLSSMVGKGSVFKVTIPQVEVSSAEFIKRDDIANPGAIAFKKGNILIVDDISSNIEMVETLLDPTELEVSSAESGEIALEVLNHLIPDLILMDIRMPGMDGFEVAARIKSNPSLAHIPVIAFTAAVFDSARIMNSGNFDAILLKPVSRTELFDRLAQFLQHEIAPSESGSVESKFTLPDRIKNQLPVIKDVIDREIMPEYYKIKDHLVLFRIEEFAKSLKKVAEKFNFELLNNYADDFLRNLEIVDLDLIEETLEGFPGFIDKIFKRNKELE